MNLLTLEIREKQFYGDITIRQKKEKKETPEMYQVENIIPVGSYGIQIVWKDGFDDGIYSWDLLWRFGEYMEVKNSLSADFEHDHNHNHKEGKK